MVHKIKHRHHEVGMVDSQFSTCSELDTSWFLLLWLWNPQDKEVFLFGASSARLVGAVKFFQKLVSTGASISLVSSSIS